MADAINLTDGTTTIQLYYDTSGFELISSGLQFGLPEHELLWHKSDWQDGETLIRENLRNREWPMKLAVRGSTADGLANTLIAFNRLVRQARRYDSQGDVDKVYMTFTPDGGQTTNYDVAEVRYDQLAFMEYFNRQQGEVMFGEGFRIAVVTKPWGYGTEVTLANELGTPHFEEDGDSDGLADQWTRVAGTTTALDTTTYLFGTQSQHLTTPTTATSGIYSDAVTVSGVDNIAAYAWVYRGGSGTDDITADVQADVTGSVGTATYDTATETDIGAAGNTWYRLDVTGSTTASDTSASLYIRRLAGTATTDFYVDKCYLGLAATAVPAGWMSTRNIVNHHDTDEGDINYVDFWVPGDLPAQTEMDIEHTAASDDADYLALAHYWGAPIQVQGEDMATDTTNWGTSTESTASGGAFMRGPNDGSCYDNVDSTYFENLPVRIVARVRSGDTANKFTMEMGEVSEAKSVNEIGIWEVIDFGVLNPNVVPEFRDRESARYLEFDISTYASSTIDLDYVSVIPSIVDGTAIIDRGAHMTTDDITYITYNGDVVVKDEVRIFNPESAYNTADMIGATPTLEPDKREHFHFWIPRFTPATYSGDTTSDAHKLTVRYKPRTEFFLGTT